MTHHAGKLIYPQWLREKTSPTEELLPAAVIYFSDSNTYILKCHLYLVSIIHITRMCFYRPHMHRLTQRHVHKQKSREHRVKKKRDYWKQTVSRGRYSNSWKPPTCSCTNTVSANAEAYLILYVAYIASNFFLVCGHHLVLLGNDLLVDVDSAGILDDGICCKRYCDFLSTIVYVAPEITSFINTYGVYCNLCYIATTLPSKKKQKSFE